MLDDLRALALREPLAVRGAVAVVVAVAAHFGLDVDPQVVIGALAAAGFVVVAGRRHVTPDHPARTRRRQARREDRAALNGKPCDV